MIKNFDWVQPMADELAKAFEVPSAVLAVSTDEGTHIACTGEATPQTEYIIASMSKSFLATSILIAQQEGLLDIDKPIKNYLPEFKMYDDYVTEHLTLRDALSHRSGLPRHDLLLFTAPGDTMERRLQRLQYLKPFAEIRQKWYYNNHMYDMATAVLERVSGKTQVEYVTEKLLKPLGMVHTNVKASDNVIQGYYKKDGKIVPMGKAPAPHGMCGGVGSTGEDLAKYIEFHRKGNPDVLEEKLKKQLYTPQMIMAENAKIPEISFNCYGMGFMLESYRGYKMVHHGGNINGYSLMQGFSPDGGFSYIWLTNLNGNASVAAVRYMLADKILELEPVDWIGRIKTIQEQAKKTENPMAKIYEQLTDELPEDWEKLCGTFENPGYGRITIINKDGRPYFPAIGGGFYVRWSPMGWFVDVYQEHGLLIPVKQDGDDLAMCLEEALPEDFFPFKRIK